MALKKATCFAATFLFVTALAVRGYSQACPFQSPRNIKPVPFPGVYNGTPPSRPDSLVTDIVGAETIKYHGQILQRCDQHYHVPVENPQGCRDEQTGKPPEPDKVPNPGQWIEVHTVYAAEVSSDPKCSDRLDHALACCVKPPFVVRGFSARLTFEDGREPPGTPIIPPIGRRPLAEWTGSNTGPDKEPNECKPIVAEWSSLVSCQVTVSQKQLRVESFHAHGARGVQPNNRLSHDLALVTPTPPSGGQVNPPPTTKVSKDKPPQ
jgi:hypothetical protein